MAVPRVVLRRVAKQFGRPSGVFGRVVIARMLNKGNQGTVTAAVEALAPAAGAVVADIGFGGGIGIGLLLDRVGPNGHVHGVDISSTMISRAARFGTDRLRLHVGSVTALPLDTASVNGAICVNTVYFVDDLPTAFGELARVLVPGGRLVLGVADPTWMARMPWAPYGFRLRPVEALLDGLTTAGLRQVDHRRVGTGELAFHLLVVQRPA